MWSLFLKVFIFKFWERPELDISWWRWIIFRTFWILSCMDFTCNVRFEDICELDAYLKVCMCMTKWWCRICAKWPWRWKESLRLIGGTKWFLLLLCWILLISLSMLALRLKSCLGKKGNDAVETNLRNLFEVFVRKIQKVLKIIHLDILI